MIWTSVKKGLPKDEEVKLVTCKTQKGVKNVNRAYYSNGSWHGSGSMSGVIAWADLPEPYDETEEERDTAHIEIDFDAPEIIKMHLVGSEPALLYCAMNIVCHVAKKTGQVASEMWAELQGAFLDAEEDDGK